MYARILATIALAMLSTVSAPALAGNYAYFDRPDAVNLNSHAAVSSDSYVRAFGWAWGDIRFQPDQSAPKTDERQARDSAVDPHDALPDHGHDSTTPPRTRRGKISMS
ncbi:hypothetical protein [Cupriavidus sp. BIS7]|uniref:hypothetical protein n=1 Tax=Cupriavidus sp. BIS7 TaxID=1217718 RepID=UPI0002E6D008|nr:hypothetical protein [Cupriavidus sp. BIS7]